MSISSLFIWPLFEPHDRYMVMLILVKQEKSRKVVLIIGELVCVLSNVVAEHLSAGLFKVLL